VPGSLTVVGTGIQIAGQLTAEARAELIAADEVLYLVSDIVALRSLEKLNAKTRSLHGLYEPGKVRTETYEAITQEIVDTVLRGGRICVALYGHPGVFAQPAHEAVRRLQEQGRPARMLPAVSAEDCLFADLHVDPGATGCQSYEATDFLIRQRVVDTTAALVLWQIGVVGNITYTVDADVSKLGVLVDCLCELYPAEHEVVLYEASPFLGADAIAQRVPLADLTSARVSAATTLYVPPASPRRADAVMLERLGLASGGQGEA